MRVISGFSLMASLMATSFFASAQDATTMPPPPEPPPVVYSDAPVSGAAKTLVDGSIVRQPFLGIITNDKPGFRTTWENKVAIDTITVPKAKRADAALVIGTGMAFREIYTYLPKADDSSTNMFVDSLTFFMNIGAKDKLICEIMLPGSNPSISAKQNADLEERMTSVFLERLMPSLAAVVVSGADGEEQLLEDDGIRDLVTPVILSMSNKHGPDSVRRLGSLNDTSIDSMQRCEAMAWMMEGFVELPEHDRAMLARTLFSKQGRDAAAKAQ